MNKSVFKHIQTSPNQLFILNIESAQLLTFCVYECLSKRSLALETSSLKAVKLHLLIWIKMFHQMPSFR